MSLILAKSKNVLCESRDSTFLFLLHRPNLWAGGGDGERARLQCRDHVLLLVDEPARDDG